VVELGYVLRGGSGLLGNKSELARMRRLGRLLISFNLTSKYGRAHLSKTISCPPKTRPSRTYAAL
jgi:hypothetical protein